MRAPWIAESPDGAADHGDARACPPGHEHGHDAGRDRAADRRHAWSTGTVARDAHRCGGGDDRCRGDTPCAAPASRRRRGVGAGVPVRPAVSSSVTGRRAGRARTAGGLPAEHDPVSDREPGDVGPDGLDRAGTPVPEQHRGIRRPQPSSSITCWSPTPVASICTSASPLLRFRRRGSPRARPRPARGKGGELHRGRHERSSSRTEAGARRAPVRSSYFGHQVLRLLLDAAGPRRRAPTGDRAAPHPRRARPALTMSAA